MEDFGPREVASTVHILAKKRHRPSGHDFLAQLDARVETVVRECNSQGVANLTWSHAAMGREPGGRVLAQLDAWVEAVARECNQQHVAHIMWACATMGRNSAEQVLGARSRRARREGSCFVS